RAGDAAARGRARRGWHPPPRRALPWPWAHPLVGDPTVRRAGGPGRGRARLNSDAGGPEPSTPAVVQAELGVLRVDALLGLVGDEGDAGVGVAGRLLAVVGEL